MIYRFGECELDDERFELRRRGTVAKLEPKVFDVLVYLVRRPERVVTKAELLDAIWPGVSVSESVLPKCVAAARRAVGDTRAKAGVIATIHGRGYRCLAPVTSESGAEASTVAARTGEPAYVGRSALRRELDHALDATVAGSGRMIVLLGEAGIGKTRTAEALLRVARDRGVTVAIGRAHEGGAPAYWPWVHPLRALVTTPELGPSLVADDAIAPEVAALLPELGRCPHERPRGEGRDARFRLFDGLTRILRRASMHRPLVLLLEDLHWADGASLELLALLAMEVGTMPVFVIGTCRDDEIDRNAPLSELMRILARAPACAWLSIGGLDRAETATLVDALAPTPQTPTLRDTIHDLTNGNPFFIHELARLLTTGGVTAITDLAAMAQSPPRRIRDALRRRLDALSDDCRAILGVAAVLGQEIDVAMLAAVADLPRDRVLGLLGEARVAALVDADPSRPSRYVFHHALVRHALYDDLEEPARVGWHRRAGAWLEARAVTDPDPQVDAIAHHYFAAIGGGESGRAVAACARAAARAEALHAYQQAAQLYERALTALASADHHDEPERVGLLLGLGEARTAAGERDAAHDVFARAAAAARTLGRADLLARAALGHRGPADMGSPSDPDSAALLDEALTGVGDAFPALRARLLSRMAGMPSRAATMSRRAELGREAYALTARADDALALRDALSARLWAALGPDHVDERLAVGDALWRFGERERSLPMTLLAHDATFGAHLLRGDMAAAERALAAYGATAASMKQPAFLFLATYWDGSLRLARGDLDGAERAFRDAIARGRGTVPYAHFMYAGQMYPLLYLRGVADDPELAGIFFGEMMAVPYAFEPAVRSALAFALWFRGDHAAARAEFEHVAAMVEAGIQRDEHWLITIGSLARLAVLFGDAERGATYYAWLAPYAALVVVHDLLRAVGDPVTAVLGHLSLLLRRFDEGVRHYEAALATTEAMRARLSQIDTQLGYARLLEARGGARERRRADALRREATATMEVLGVRRNWVLDAGAED